MPDVPFHEAARIFPLLEGDDFDKMVEDIRENGLLVPIEIFEDKIIDGRNRYRGCLLAGIEPDFVEVEADDPIAYVISLNLHRRHLTDGERAVAADEARDFYEKQAKERQKLSKGRGKKGPDTSPDLNKTGDARDKVGAAFGVSGKTVDRMRQVREDGVPELTEAVKKHDLPVATAAKLAELSKPEQQKALKGGKAAIKEAIASTKPETPPPKYPATVQVLSWLSSIDFGMGMIKQEYGSLPKMVAGRKWNKSQSEKVVKLIGSVHKDFTTFQKEMVKLCPKL